MPDQPSIKKELFIGRISKRLLASGRIPGVSKTGSATLKLILGGLADKTLPQRELEDMVAKGEFEKEVIDLLIKKGVIK